MGYFAYKLIPPRPSFDQDMSDSEAVIMGDHFSYWKGLLGTGAVVVYGPVSDPAGTWGLAVVEADSEAGVEALGRADPAVKSGMATFEVLPMATAIVRSGTP
jgi:uncharacterized protein